jgi:cystathionine beta-lyase/cystathionine gamma-synthase
VSIARGHPARPRVAVDNTFLGPVFQHPLALGADLAVYSGTKFLGGFSDILAGVVMASDPTLVSELRGLRALFGNILQADESWILDSRLSTVGLRMNRQSKNAQNIAERLVEHRRVRRIFYPSLFKEAEQVRVRDAQCDFPGSVFSLELDGGRAGAFEFLRRLKIAKNAVSLGGVETLACHPLTTTHSELSARELAEPSTGRTCWPTSSRRCGRELLRRHPDRAVEADRLTVQHLVLDDVTGERRELRGAAESFRERNVLGERGTSFLGE